MSTRIFLGYILLIVIFIFAAGMAAAPYIDPNVYFYCTLLMVGSSGLCSALLAAIFGVVASQPPVYTSAVTSGQGLGGTIPAISQLILALAPKLGGSSAPTSTLAEKDQGTVTYFLISVGLCALGLAGHILLNYIEKTTGPQEDLGEYEPVKGSSSLEDDIELSRSNSFSPRASHFDLKLPPQSKDSSEESIASSLSTEERKLLNKSLSALVWSVISSHVFAVGATFFITLAIFPAITASVLSTTSSPQSDALFVTVHFLVYV